MNLIAETGLIFDIIHRGRRGKRDSEWENERNSRGGKEEYRH